MTVLSIRREHILKSRLRKATLNLQLLSRSKSTTRNLESTEHKLIMRIPRMNHILVTRMIHQMLMTRKTNHHQRIVKNMLHFQNHRAIRMKKMTKKRKKKAANMKNKKEPMMIPIKWRQSDRNIMEKTLNRNLKNLTGKNCQNTVSIINNIIISNQLNRFIKI